MKHQTRRNYYITKTNEGNFRAYEEQKFNDDMRIWLNDEKSVGTVKNVPILGDTYQAYEQAKTDAISIYKNPIFKFAASL
jgi:hypothetical protein